MQQSDEKKLATVRSERELLAVFRARQDQLNITHETIDSAAGLADRYSAKLLGSTPIKHLGVRSLGALLGVLGLRLDVVEDREALARIKPQLTTRKAAKPHLRAVK